MPYILDEVKGRLSDMIQRLQSDIPGIRLGVIAHGMKIHAVQALNTNGVKDFYRSGLYLRLENFSNICVFIMAICYRERDDGLFLNYEAKVERPSGFYINSTSKRDQVPNVSAKPTGRRGPNSGDSGASSSGCSWTEPSGTVHRYGSFSSVSSASSSSPHIPAVITPLSVTTTSTVSNTHPATGNSHRSSSPKQRRISKKTSNKRRNTATKGNHCFLVRRIRKCMKCRCKFIQEANCT